MQFGDRIREEFDEIAVGCAVGIAIGSYATNPSGHAFAGGLAAAVAYGVLSYVIAWAVLR